MTTTVANDTLVAVMARLQSSPAIDDVVTTRRMHLVPLTEDECPGINVLDGDDEPKGADNGCQQKREATFIVRVITRGDDEGLPLGYVVANAALERLDPANDAMPAYPNGVTLEFSKLQPTVDIADEDAVALDLHFVAKYTAASFRLSSPAS